MMENGGKSGIDTWMKRGMRGNGRSVFRMIVGTVQLARAFQSRQERRRWRRKERSAFEDETRYNPLPSSLSHVFFNRVRIADLFHLLFKINASLRNPPPFISIPLLFPFFLFALLLHLLCFALAQPSLFIGRDSPFFSTRGFSTRRRNAIRCA